MMGECVLAKGVNSVGYGHHRRKWIASKGQIPQGLVLDHLCNNRACEELSHLELVTQSENVLRGNKPLQNRQTPRPSNCPSGHPYSVFLREAVYARKDRGNRPHVQRYCKECKRLKQAENRARISQKEN